MPILRDDSRPVSDGGRPKLGDAERSATDMRRVEHRNALIEAVLERAHRDPANIPRISRDLPAHSKLPYI